MSDKNKSADPSDGGEGGNTPSDSGDGENAETQTVPKAEFDELQERFKKQNTSFKSLKTRIAELEAAASKPAPEPEPDPDDKGGDDKGGDDKTGNQQAANKRDQWRDKYFSLKDDYEKKLKAKDDEIESIRGEKREFKKDRLLADLVAQSKARKSSQALVLRLIRDEFELSEADADEGGDSLDPRDGSAMAASKWLERWLDETDDGGFKESPRAAGTTDDAAGASKAQQRKPGQPLTPQMLQGMDRKARIKALSENPELRDKMANKVVDRSR